MHGTDEKYTDFGRNFEVSSPEKHEGRREKNIEEKFREIACRVCYILHRTGTSVGLLLTR
jgi:hypothetical protein